MAVRSESGWDRIFGLKAKQKTMEFESDKISFSCLNFINPCDVSAGPHRGSQTRIGPASVVARRPIQTRP